MSALLNLTVPGVLRGVLAGVFRGPGVFLGVLPGVLRARVAGVVAVLLIASSRNGVRGGRPPSW